MEVLAEIRYDRGNQIGVGQGMNSKVFLAHDPQLGGEFAVKEIEKSKFGNDITSYFMEAQAMFATTHPSIVPIRYACQTAAHVVLAMPYYVRGSLADRTCHGPITTTELIRIAQGVLHGITRIHAAGFIHFDIKPSNILFDNVDAPLVADFGQTRRILPNGTVTVPAMYIRGIPPEIWKGGVGTPLSDIYQAGMLFYRAINGDPLYRDQCTNLDDDAVRRLTIAGRFPDRNMFLPHVPKRVRSIIRKALNPDPSKRYQSATEFSAAMGRIPPSLNWRTIAKSQGQFSGRAERLGKADLEVELVLSDGSWSVRIWTADGTARRARNRAGYWRSNLTQQSAMQHLNELFARLV